MIHERKKSVFFQPYFHLKIKIKTKALLLVKRLKNDKIHSYIHRFNVAIDVNNPGDFRAIVRQLIGHKIRYTV